MIKKNVVGIIFKNKKLLLQLRDNKKDIIFPNSWGFFGGEVKINEDHDKAIKRELYEELHIKKFRTLRFVNSHFNSKYRCIFFIYSLKLEDNIILKEGYDYDYFFENKFLIGKKSKKNGIFYKAAEVELMRKVFFLSKRFI